MAHNFQLKDSDVIIQDMLIILQYYFKQNVFNCVSSAFVFIIT